MTFITSVSEPSLWSSSFTELFWCWNMVIVRQIASALSSSVILSVMIDFFQASRVDTSGTLSETTLMWLTTPGGSDETLRDCSAATGRGIRKASIQRMVHILLAKSH